MVRAETIILFAGSISLFVVSPCCGFESFAATFQPNHRAVIKSTTSLNGLFDSFKTGGSGKDNLDEEVRPACI